MKDKTQLQYWVRSEMIEARIWSPLSEDEDSHDEINFGRYYVPDNGCDWEGTIKFGAFSNDRTWAKVALFDDAWAAFADPKVRRALASLHRSSGKVAPTVDEVARVLDKAGFVRQVPTPRVEKPKCCRECHRELPMDPKGGGR